MDRKAIIILLITVGAMLGWQFVIYPPLAEKSRKAIEAFRKMQEEEKAKQAALSPATTTTPTQAAAPAQQPGATTPATPTPATPAPAPAAVPSEPEQRKTLASVPGTV